MIRAMKHAVEPYWGALFRDVQRGPLSAWRSAVDLFRMLTTKA